MGAASIWRVRRRFVEQGLDHALNRRPQPERPQKRNLTGEVEAHLIAITCGEKPEGEGRWSLRLLANKLVALEEVDEVSYETVRRILKKRTQAVAEGAVVHSSQAECRVCLPYGGGAASLHTPIRLTLPATVHG